MRDTKVRRRLSSVALGVAGLQLLVGLAVSLSPNAEGSLGGILYAAMYAVPLVMIALGLRSSHRAGWVAAGWAALLLAIYYSVIVAMNWSGYSTTQATFALAITAPTVALDLLTFAMIVPQSLRSQHEPG